MMEQQITGCVHLYTGDGKGKTTAAVGLAVRAVSRGLRVGFVQFLKSGASGELAGLAKLGVWVPDVPATGKFIWNMDEAERAACRAAQEEILAAAAGKAEELDLLVLDEAMGALAAGMLNRSALLAFVQNKPPALELVLTGRCEDDAFPALADYITEMRMVAHPFEKGRPARRGIEF